jgi:glycosyltransferase involved in cell wall biosynthesis
MKIAIVHPWFLMRGGGEKVVDVLADMYPDADIYALFASREHLSSHIKDRNVKSSILNKVPFSSKLHRQLLPLYPLAAEYFDLNDYDVVISSGGPGVMGVNTRQDAVHIYYCHTPQRSWWDLYAEHQAQLPRFTRQLFVLSSAFVRTWEFAATQRVDHIVSNSYYIADRVLKYFRRPSTVIYPPVDISMGYIKPTTDTYYLSVGRLEKQKKLDLLIHACNTLRRRLLVVGTGKEERYLKSIAGPTIEFFGYVPQADLIEFYANCRCFLFAADEDFGIAPVEAQAFGRPVIAYGHGGSLETVRVNDPDGRPDTGAYFHEQSTEAVIDAILLFEAQEGKFSPADIQQHARQFDTPVFENNLRAFVDNAYALRRNTNSHKDLTLSSWQLQP